MTERLVAIADRTIMGDIQRDHRGRLAFFYDDHWRSLDAAYLLSLSMPLVVAEHGHARIEPWLWGLLPTTSSSWLAGSASDRREQRLDPVT